MCVQFPYTTLKVQLFFFVWSDSHMALSREYDRSEFIRAIRAFVSGISAVSVSSAALVAKRRENDYGFVR